MVESQSGAAQVRRRLRRLYARAALCAASAAVVAAATPLTASAAGTQSALAAVTSAAAKTAMQSYHVSEVTTQILTSHFKSRHIVTIRDNSVFDPAHHLGAETLILHPDVPNVTAIRYIGKYAYLYFPVPIQGALGTDGKHWMRDVLSPGVGYHAPEKVAAAVISGWDNSQDLLAILKSLGTVRKVGPASGPGWKGTKYSFTATFNDYIAGTIAGTVDLDQQGRVRQLTLPLLLSPYWASFTGIKSINFDLTFSDFDSRVSVTAPPAKQVYAPANVDFTYPSLYFQCAANCFP